MYIHIYKVTLSSVPLYGDCWSVCTHIYEVTLSSASLYGDRWSMCTHIYKWLGPHSHISFTTKKSFFPIPWIFVKPDKPLGQFCLVLVGWKQVEMLFYVAWWAHAISCINYNKTVTSQESRSPGNLGWSAGTVMWERKRPLSLEATGLFLVFLSEAKHLSQRFSLKYSKLIDFSVHNI